MLSLHQFSISDSFALHRIGDYSGRHLETPDRGPETLGRHLE